jgi:CTP synthase (UTP-ammonia lyase)
LNVETYHFDLWNNIRSTISKNHSLRGNKKNVEQVYDNLSNTIRHDQCLLEFDRRFCNGKLGDMFQIPDYSNPTPEDRTDAILTNERNKLGKMKIGNKNYKFQFKYRCPTTYFSAGIKRNHVHDFENMDIQLLMGIPKTSDVSYYSTRKSVNTKEHHYFLWMPNHPKYESYEYVDKKYMRDIYFPLQPLREILDFELLEKDQSILDDFI